ncbi:hypothetical protein U0070_009478 [Myodes glareolus]|uniref:Kinesin motor domain-containing protein n=1 Tax=Myodes glareolus TaxID=447135 RepID=A0AAW0I8L0_MYOGA
MSVHTWSNRHNSGSLEGYQKTSSPIGLPHSSRLKVHLKSNTSECENRDPLLSAGSKPRDINRTYVISACKKESELPVTPDSSRLTLQRRTTWNKESSLLGSELGDTTRKTADTSLRLQRRHANTGFVGKMETTCAVGGDTENSRASQATRTKAELVSNNTRAVSSAVSGEGSHDTGVVVAEKRTDAFPALSSVNERGTVKNSNSRAPGGSQCQAGVVRSGHLAGKPVAVASKLDVQVSGAGDSHDGNTAKNIAKNVNKSGSLETRTPGKCVPEPRLAPRRDLPPPKSPAVTCLKNRMASPQVKPRPKSSLLANKRERSQESTLPPEEKSAVQNTFAEADFFRVENSQVTVAVRVRPFSKREKMEKASQVVFRNGEEITVEHPDMKQIYSFVYDVSFWSFDEAHPGYASQTTVYETLAAPLLQRAFEGYNTCLFAYGQTGSGKSYTMMGLNEEPGIIPRFCEDLFAQVAKKQTSEVSYHLEMSFFEVYNEKIHDLLLRVREHPVSGPYVEALSMNVVSSYSDIQTEFVEGEEHDHRITSRINLIDLAGSERCSAAHTSGERLKEGVSINKSLLTLGKVISALSEQANGKRVFIPYRESVLTWQVEEHWLLKESLGGNSKTAMIATISPAASNIEETLSTLRYATQARLIVNIAKVNEDMNAKLIRELKAEIEKLKAAQRNNRNIDPERYRLCRQEITSLRMKLHQQERDMAELQRVWKEKFEQAEKRKLQETKELQKAGVTFQMDNHLPNLVNLNEDPQLSEMLLYMVKEGITTVGKYKPDSSHDIQLSGVLIADDHCTIRNFGGTVSIVPAGEAKTYVNGMHISEPTVLHHGDRVILGGDHYFRFNHPVEVQKGLRPSSRQTLTSEGPKDFEFAKNELLMAQRSQLEAEIKDAQLKAKEEMMQGIQIAKDMAQQELSSQKAAYESKIRALEAELREESQRKKMEEINNQKANDKIEELEKAKQHLEQEVYVNKRRLEMETLATKQALEDHSIHHARILEALEIEKQKIAKEVQILQENRGNRDKTFIIQPNWSSMKLSMMIQEANAISDKLKKYYVFVRMMVVAGLRMSFATLKMSGNLTLRAHQFLPFLEGGLIEKSSAIYSNSSESFLPGICKELIGSSIDFLEQNYDEEKTIADSLMGNLLKLHNGLLAISKAHEEQDEESQSNLFSSDRAAQALTVQMACAFEQLVVLFKHWLDDSPPGTSSARLEDELRQDIKKLGGYLQLFLQEFTSALQDGLAVGMESLLDSGLEKAQQLERALSRQSAREEIAKRMKANAVELVKSLGNTFAEWRQKNFRTQIHEGSRQQGSRMVTLALEFLKLKCCLEKTVEIITSALRGCPSDLHCLRSCTETLCTLAPKLHSDVIGPSTSAGSCGKLESLAKSLLFCSECGERPGLLKPEESHNQQSEGEQCESGGADCSRDVPACAGEPHRDTSPAVSSQACAPQRIQWV